MCFPCQANLSCVFSGALTPLPIMPVMQEFREPGRATWNHSVSKNSQHCSSCWTQCVFLFKLTCQLYFQVHWSRSQSWCKNFESLRQISAASASEAPAIPADNYELADTLGSYSSLYLQESARPPRRQYHWQFSLRHFRPLPPHRDLAPLARLLRRLHGVPAPARWGRQNAPPCSRWSWGLNNLLIRSDLWISGSEYIS